MNACKFTLIAALIIISGCSSKKHQAESIVKQGIQNAQKGDLDKAIDDFDQAIELDPQNADAYYNRGRIKNQLKEWDEAVADFTRSIKLNPQNADAYLNRGFAEISRGNLDESMTNFTQTIALDSKNFRAYYSRGYGKASGGDLDGAIADYSRAIELDPKDAYFFGSRGVAKYEKGDLDGALADFTRAVKIKSDYTNTLFAHVYDSRGVLKMDRGDMDGAIADFDQALALAPQDAGTYMNRGVANYLNHQASAAIADLQKAAELHFSYSDYPRIFTWLIKAEKADQLAAANKELGDYLLARDGGPNDWPVQVGHFLIGDLSQSDFLEAADSIDSKKDKQQHCEAYFYVAIKHLLAGDKLAAKSFFQQCIDTDLITFYEYRMARIKLKQLEGEN
jgi:lipoprotein NlpI